VSPKTEKRPFLAGLLKNYSHMAWSDKRYRTRDTERIQTGTSRTSKQKLHKSEDTGLSVQQIPTEPPGVGDDMKEKPASKSDPFGDQDESPRPSEIIDWVLRKKAEGLPYFLHQIVHFFYVGSDITFSFQNGDRLCSGS
jgi:hypothetical protein